MGVDVSPIMILGRIVGPAAFEIALTTGVLQEDALIKSALDRLHKMRQIAVGKTIEVVIYAGLTGFTLPDSVTCETPLSILRPADPRMTESDCPWTIWTLPLGVPPPVLFSTTIPYHVDIVRLGDLQDNAFEAMTGRVAPMRLAVLLASSRDLPLLRARLVQVAAVLPHGGAFTYAPPGERRPISDLRSVTRQEVGNVSRFATALEAGPTDSIDVAMSRTLSAATERGQAADALIDAVIAWEDVVGTDAETSFRVKLRLLGSWRLISRIASSASETYGRSMTAARRELAARAEW